MHLFLIAVLNQHLHGLTQHICGEYVALKSVHAFHEITHIGHGLVQLLVCLFLVFEAAHESSADTGDLGGIKGKILFLCHLDGHRYEIRKICGATHGSSAGSQTAYGSGFIADTDLTQFDPGPEGTCEILYQFSEIDISVRSEIE